MVPYAHVLWNLNHGWLSDRNAFATECEFALELSFADAIDDRRNDAYRSGEQLSETCSQGFHTSKVGEVVVNVRH
jgi:hypothetical protein